METTHKNRTAKDLEKEYSVPSEEKNGELALFYNLAYNRISKFTQAKNTSLFNQEFEIRDLFFPKNSQQDRADFEENRIYEMLFSESTYADLKLYLFKEAQGPTIRWVNQADIKIINLMLLQMLRLRDYHSHFYHDDFAIWVCEDLKSFLLKKYKTAVNSYLPKYSNINYLSEDKGIFQKGNAMLNYTGINFFLSFFLSRGQMELFMSNRQYFKNKGIKANDDGTIKDFDFSRHIVTFYTLSDAHQLNTLGLEKNNIPEYDKHKYLSVLINNYLLTTPEFIYDIAKMSLKPTKDVTNTGKTTLVERNATNFLPLAVKWMAFRAYPDIEWKVSQKEETEKIPERLEEPDKTSSDNLETPHSYFDLAYLYKTEISAQDNPILFDNNVRIRVKITETQFVNLRINKTDFIAWCSARLHKKEDEWMSALKEFSEGFVAWVDYLHDKSKAFELSEFPIFEKFLNYQRNNGKGILPNQLIDWYYSKSMAENEAKEQLKNSIATKLDKILVKIKDEEKGFRAYESKSSLLKSIDQKNIQHQIRFKFLNKDDRNAVVQFNRDVKEAKPLRFEKMQIIHACLRLLFGRKARFAKRDFKNGFDKYCYLLDIQQHKEERLVLITEWLNKFRLSTEHQEQHKANRKETFNEQFVDILEKKAISFDDLFGKILTLTEKKIQFEKENIEQNTEWKNLYGLAKKYHVPYVLTQQVYDEPEAQTGLATLLQAFRSNNEERYFYNLALPAHFTKNAISDTSYKAIFKPLEKEKTYTAQKTQWKGYVEYKDQVIFDEFATLVQDKSQKKVILKAKQLHLCLIEDVLLSLMFREIKKQDWHFDSQKRFVQANTLDTEMKVFIKNTNPSLSFWVSAKEMYKNDSFLQGDRLRKIAERLYHQNNKKTTFKLIDLKQAIQVHWSESRNMISQLLHLEEIIAKEEAIHLHLKNTVFEESKMYKASLERIRFEEVLTKTNIPLDLNRFRNIALHGDILPLDEDYKKLTNTIKEAIRTLKSRDT